ncbi:unnamed protein product, partial [Ectocarpus sp. 6 AP-2014]
MFGKCSDEGGGACAGSLDFEEWPKSGTPGPMFLGPKKYVHRLCYVSISSFCRRRRIGVPGRSEDCSTTRDTATAPPVGHRIVHLRTEACLRPLRSLRREIKAEGATVH